jgi:ketosteroid isomerase-like protein
MSKILFSFILSGILFSCSQKKPVINAVALKMELLDADRSFSKMSELQGMRSAYMEYIDSNGVLLRPNNFPVTGGDAVDLISQTNDSAYIITWDPKSASIAASGELGYTYGIYSYKLKKADSVLFGTYVTIWKKQPAGKWKFVLQTANEGVE